MDLAELHNFDERALYLGLNTYREIPAEEAIQLLGDSELDISWICSGNLTINGNGSTLDFAHHALVIGDLSGTTTAKITLENIVLKNINLSSIAAFNENDCIIFKNVGIMVNDVVILSIVNLEITYQELHKILAPYLN